MSRLGGKTIAKQVQLFSERCCGSNYLEAFLERNLPGLVITQEFGYKHWFPIKPVEQRLDLVYLLLVRSPFAWIRSLYRQPWHAAHHLRQLTFSDFIRAEWSCVLDEHAGVEKGDPRWGSSIDSERHPRTGELFSNVLEMRTVKHQTWLDISNISPDGLLAAYEELVRDPLGFCTTIAQHVGLEPPSRVSIPKGYRGRMSWKMKTLYACSFGLIGGYREKKKEPLHPDDIDFIAGNLDPETEAYLGYDLAELARQEHALREQAARDG